MARYDIDDDEPYVVIERHSGGVGSFLVGLAIGAGIALLLAPKSGAETRRDIRRRARNAREAAERVAQDVSDSVAGTFDEARRRVEEKIEDARNAVEVKREQVRRAVDAGRAAADDARVELEGRIAEAKAAYAAGADVARGARTAPTTRPRATATARTGAPDV